MLVGGMLVVFTVQMVNDFAVLNSFAIFMPVVSGGGVRVLVVLRLRLLSPDVFWWHALRRWRRVSGESTNVNESCGSNSGDSLVVLCSWFFI